jgi:LysM repeat protein
MKRILCGIVITLLAITVSSAQVSATQQQLEELNGRLQTLIEGQTANERRIEVLAREVSQLRDKVNTPPPANDGPSREDLRKLARTVQELAEKQQADKDLILENIRQLGRAISGEPAGSGKKTPKAGAKKIEPTKNEDPAPPSGPLVGHEYKVQPGDSLGVIVKAFRDKGVKVTTAQVLKANPGLDADKLYVGKVIFIPDPAAK